MGHNPSGAAASSAQRAKPEVYAILRDVAAAGAKGVNGGDGDEDVVLLRWFELPSALQHSHCGTWNLLWTWRPPRVNHTELLPWQRVNHFPQSRQLTRKDLLKKNLHRRHAVVSGRLAEACDILPLTFILPKEYVAFCDAFARCAEAEGEANVWIMKPVGLSRGRGISMLNDISGVSYGEAMVIQRYVNPTRSSSMATSLTSGSTSSSPPLPPSRRSCTRRASAASRHSCTRWTRRGCTTASCT